MRVDLFLKASRLVKRRTVGQELCDAGRVLVNGQPAKPAKEIRPGDRLTLAYSTRTLEIEVLSVPPSAKHMNAAPEELYRVTADRRNAKDGH